MGSVFGMEPKQDCVQQKLYINWIYQWSWVLLGLDWFAFYSDINTPNEPYISGCFKAEMCQPATFLDDVCLTADAVVTHQVVGNENQAEEACRDYCENRPEEVKLYQFVYTRFTDEHDCKCFLGPSGDQTLKQYVEANKHSQSTNCQVGITNKGAAYAAELPTWTADVNEAQTTVTNAVFKSPIVFTSIAAWGLYIYAPSTLALLIGQLLSCKRLRSKSQQQEEDYEPGNPISAFIQNAKEKLSACGLSKREKNTWEAFWFSTSSIAVLISQIAAVVMAIMKYWQLGWSISGNWYNQMTEITWLVLVILTATRLEYLKTRGRMMRTIGLFGDLEEGQDDHMKEILDFGENMGAEDARVLIDEKFNTGCLEKSVAASLNCNLFLSTKCQVDSRTNKDPCWLIGCNTPIRHLWFVTIFLDWTQTFNYWYYVDDELNGMNVFYTFAIPSLLFTIWGTSFLLTSQLSQCRAMHMLRNRSQGRDAIEDSTLVPGVLAISDLFWDEIPNLVLTSLFWINGGLSGSDQTAATLSIVQGVFATMTCIAHVTTAVYNYWNAKYDDGQQQTRVPTFMDRRWVGDNRRSAAALTMLIGVLVGALGPIVLILHIIAVCIGSSTFFAVLGHILKCFVPCFRCLCCCCTCCEEYYDGNRDSIGSPSGISVKRQRTKKESTYPRDNGVELRSTRRNSASGEGANWQYEDEKTERSDSESNDSDFLGA